MNLIKKYYWIIFAFFVFIIYLTTLAPSVVQIDSGELAAVQAIPGIAHPTGYPLFTILGYLFSTLNLNTAKIYQLNILAAIWCSLGAGIFVYNVKLVLDNLKTSAEKRKDKKKSKSKEKKEKESTISENIKILSSILAGLILVFSRTFWLQSTSVEVYSLHIFLINLIILFLLKAFFDNNSSPNKIFKIRWLIFAAVLALGFTNHMTTLLIIPGAAYLYFIKNKFNKSSIKTILLMLLVFIPVIVLLYLYLPVRASQNPALNWGNPVNLENIIRHVSGKQYQVWLFSSSEAAREQLVSFFNSLSDEFYISLFICLTGFIVSFFISGRIAVFLLICFVSTIAYSINYDITDIDSYFLLAYISLSFFSVFGIVKILAFLKINKSGFLLPAILISVFIGVEFYYNYKEADQSKIYTFRDYTLEVLDHSPKNSVVFSYQWDYFLSASYYFRFVENYRRDVAVIDKELLRRSWYYHQLRTNYPEVIKGIKNEIEDFVTAVKPFERDEKYNANLLESLYRKLMTNLVRTNIEERSFYIAPELFENEMQRGEFQLPEGYTMIPDLFFFKVVKGNNYIPAADPDFIIRFPENENKYTDFIKNTVANMLARRAFYEIQNDKIERARVYIKKIKKDFPGYVLPAGLGQVRLDD